MSFEFSLDAAWNFATALLIGSLIGIERERHKHSAGEASIGGLRTFTLLALIGAIAGWLATELDSPWIIAAALLSAAALVVAGYAAAARSRPQDVGLTTEIAAIATCLLGAMTTLGFREISVALGIVVAAILAYKEPLHGIVAKLDRDDVYAGLRLLIATFIILPLLPDQSIDPWGALNPRSLWLLALLISGLSLVGYIATRVLGTSRGILLTGLSGGLVSSTAVTLTFSRQSRAPEYVNAASVLAGGILLAWTVMFARVLIEVLVVNPELLGEVFAPLAVMCAVAVAFTAYYRGAAATRGRSEDIPLKNPFSLRSAAKFAAFFALILLAVKLVEMYAPSTGMYFVAALSGTTDVDAITLSMAQYAKNGDNGVAANAILIAALSNTLAKAGMVFVLGSPALRGPILAATAAIVVAGSVAAIIF